MFPLRRKKKDVLPDASSADNEANPFELVKGIYSVRCISGDVGRAIAIENGILRYKFITNLGGIRPDVRISKPIMGVSDFYPKLDDNLLKDFFRGEPKIDLAVQMWDLFVSSFPHEPGHSNDILGSINDRLALANEKTHHAILAELATDSNLFVRNKAHYVIEKKSTNTEEG